MDGQLTNNPPVFFIKPADAVVDDGSTIPYPPKTIILHYEAELVIATGKGVLGYCQGV